MTKFIKIKILPYIIYIIYKLYFKTVKYIEPELPQEVKDHLSSGGNFIVAHFHQDELALIPTRARSNFYVMTSSSTDGRMMRKILSLMGYSCVEGSSTRGGSRALIEMIRTLNSKNANAVIAVDGPKGPIYKVKDGVISLAKNTGSPILPVGVKISRAFMFKNSWNKALLPKPFSTVKILFGKPIKASRDANKEEIQKYALEVEAELNKIKGQ